MNEHRKRIHGVSVMTFEELQQLQTCQAWKPTEKSSFHSIAQTDASLLVEPDFRMESTFESKIGLLNSSIVFAQGEEKRIGTECLTYFNNHEAPNPYYDRVVTFLKTANTLCSRVGSDLCRQQAMRNAEGATTTLCFRPVQLQTLHKYAAIVASLVYFATKCPWDYPISALADVPSIMHAIFFEPRISIQQSYMTK